MSLSLRLHCVFYESLYMLTTHFSSASLHFLRFNLKATFCQFAQWLHSYYLEDVHFFLNFSHKSNYNRVLTFPKWFIGTKHVSYASNEVHQNIKNGIHVEVNHQCLYNQYLQCYESFPLKCIISNFLHLICKYLIKYERTNCAIGFLFLLKCLSSVPTVTCSIHGRQIFSPKAKKSAVMVSIINENTT